MARSTVYLKVDRVAAQVAAAACAVSVSDLHEAMGSAEGKRATMAPEMRPLLRNMRVAGPAITAWCSQPRACSARRSSLVATCWRERSWHQSNCPSAS